MLSCHVMSCYVTLSVTTLPLFDTSVTVANMNNPRSDYNKCEYAQNVSIKFSKTIVCHQPDSSSLAILRIRASQRLQRLWST